MTLTKTLKDWYSYGQFRRALFCLMILGPCLWAFGNKFWELITLFRDEDDWAFTITPIINYLLASAGFLCLFFWAMFNGMFCDIEQPKLKMLANELIFQEMEKRDDVFGK